MLVVPPGSTAEEVLAARGMAVDLAVAMESVLSQFETTFSDGLRWIFGQGGQLSRPVANSKEKADEEQDLQKLIGPFKYQFPDSRPVSSTRS